MGEGKKLVRILATTSTGAVMTYELVDKPGVTHRALIENGKNAEKFEILGEQLSLL